MSQILKKNSLFSLLRFLVIIPAVSGCMTPAVFPPFSQPFSEPVSVRLIVGSGEAYRFHDENWVREPAYDYEFSVIQTIYAEGWETVKDIHRSHPEYDGRGGPRDERLNFTVRHSAPDGRGIPLVVRSSFGDGEGHADSNFRNMVVEFTPEVSRFAPFNTYRITQISGELKISETVELFKKKDGQEIPFMKMIEKGMIYDPSSGSDRR